MFNKSFTADYFNNLSIGHFPGLIGIKITHVENGLMKGEMPIKKDFFAPNGFLHAGSIVTFADSIAGYAAFAHLPEGGQSFTTLELKSNFTRGIKEGTLECECTAEHLGRTTQVWRVKVSHKKTSNTIAVFSCTQLVIY